MRFLAHIVTGALRIVHRLLFTVLNVIVSLVMSCTPMTVPTPLEREDPSDIAH